MKKKKKEPYLTKMSLIIRILASLYLLYTDYSLLTSITQTAGKERIFIVAIMIAFAAIAIPLLLCSAKALIKNEYVVPEEKRVLEVEEIVEEDKKSEEKEEKDEGGN